MFARPMLTLLASLATTTAAAAQVTHVPAYPFNGESEFYYFSFSVSGTGDVNNDGYDDVIIGALGDSLNGYEPGSARVYCGKSGTILYTFAGDSPDDYFGFAVSAAGDVNNDDFADVIVSARQGSNSGQDFGSARVFSGFDGTILHTFQSDAAGDYFGWDVSGAGDVNNDDFDDLIVSAIYDNKNGLESGNARVYCGRTGTVFYTWNGDSAGEQFGQSVGSAGDVNNDGFDDLIVGAARDSNNGEYSGSATVFSGATGAILYYWNGDAAGDQLGASVSDAGDVNNDGFPDLIIGAPGTDFNGAYSGSARVFSGADGSILHTFHGDAAENFFGTSVSGAGDVNNDDFDDLIVGGYAAANNGQFSGTTRVFCGRTGSTLYTFNGDSPFDYFGYSVSSAGDVNNDGFADFIIGAWGDDNTGTESGSARIYFSVPIPTPCPGDADGNSTINLADITTVLLHFNSTCS